MNDMPLAERMRPKKLEEFVGQNHLIGDNGILSKYIQTGKIPSIIFWGPPGVGKTTLAKLISTNVKRHFYNLSAINAGVKDVREVIESAKRSAGFDAKSPILFIDEIHRFSKSQQDSLLAAVEQGIVTLIGATTENPSFEVINPLLSRCQVFTLKGLDKDQLQAILQQALEEDIELKKRDIVLKESDALISFSGGDARKLLNLLESVVNQFSGNPVEITNAFVQEFVKNFPLHYDKDGEQHYDIISAFIKSIRGSDPNAAVYWLARMIEGGEDPKFIARRLVILASEDIGNANPNALLLATNCFTAIEQIGMPEGRIVLSQCAIYLASSPKSNSSYLAIGKAQDLVRKTGNLPIPLHLRNAPTQLMKQLDYGKGYQYPHDYPGNFANQNYLPDGINESMITFANTPREQDLKKFLEVRWGKKYTF